MGKFKKILVIICLMIGMMTVKNTIKAQPLLGADLTYTCVGKDSFVVTLTYYRDCNAVPPWADKIYAKCASTGTTIKNVTFTNPIGIDITPTCLASCNRCQSSSCSFPYGIDKYVHTELLDLSNAGSCCEIILTWSLCCRNMCITTGAAGANFYLEARLNRCLIPGNNSPVFVNDPLVILCKDRDYSISFCAIDIDKDSNGSPLDSLSYEIVPPLQSATTAVTFTGQYTYDKPFYFWGFPTKTTPLPRGFHFNSLTGTLAFRPYNVEQTVLAVKVSEWRKIGSVMTKIGEITRDVHYIIISCPSTNNPVLNGSAVKHICAGDSVTMTINSSDADVNDTIFISAYNLPLGAAWTDNNGLVKNPSGMLMWRTKLSDACSFPYNILVNAKDNSCTVSGQTSQVISIYVHPKPSAKINFQKLPCNEYKLIADELVGVSSYNWYVNGYQVSGSMKIKNTGTYAIRLQLTGPACTVNIFDTLHITSVLKAKLPNDTVLCPGNSLSVIPNISGAQGMVNFLWNTGDSSSSLQIGPLFQDTMIILNVSDSMFCHSDTMFIKVDHFGVSLSQDNIVCQGQPAVLRANPLFDEGKQAVSFGWYELSCSCPKGTMDHLIVTDSVDYFCRVFNENGCLAVDTIHAVYHKIPEITLNPIPDKCLNEADFSLDSFAIPSGGTWYCDDSSLILNNSFLISKASAKTYHVSYHYADTVTSCDNSKTVSFTVWDYPRIEVLQPLSFCDEDKEIDISGFVSPDFGIWDSLHPAIVKLHYFNPHLAAASSLPLIYLVEDTNACRNSREINYVINPVPVVDFTADSLQGYFPLSVQFTNLSTVSSGSLDYLWYFGDGDSSALVNPLHTYLSVGKYNVQLVARTDSGCLAELTKKQFIEVLTSIKEYSGQAGIIVYPNPVQDRLIIQSETELIDKVEILNLPGQPVLEVSGIKNNSTEVQRGSLPAGTYLLKVKDIKGAENFYRLVLQ